VRSRASLVALGAAIVVAVAAACGDVPTLEGGIAYISPILLPSPAVAANDTLRDSLGVAAPLRVIAYDRGGNEIPGVPVTFIPISFPASVIAIDARGFVKATDTVRAVQIVARIGARLQTTPATLQLVPQPTSMGRPTGAAAADTAYPLPALRKLDVVITGLFREKTLPAPGIIVRYRIDSLYSSSAVPAGIATLTNRAGVTLRPDSTIAVDTTDATGLATSTLVVLSSAGLDSVVVRVRARKLNADSLPGSPVRIVLKVKK
jgi:hypothetical protein